MAFDGALITDSWSERLKDRIEWWKGWFQSWGHQGHHATIDFETRSACDIKKHGSWIYSKHSTTSVLCLSYKLPWDDKPRRYHPAFPKIGVKATEDPLELFAFILAGGKVEAHNAFFERVIWRNVCAARMGWPSVPDTAWRCTASRASAASLPRDLDGAGQAMGLAVTKDAEGKKIMLKVSKPRKMKKAELKEWREAFELEHNRLYGHIDVEERPALELPEIPILWHDDRDDFERLLDYCDQDVLAEEALSLVLPELSDTELLLWQMDQEFNERGAMFDLALAEAALRAAAKWRGILNAELCEMTGILSATKRAEVKEWLKEHEGLDLSDTTGELVDWYLTRSTDDYKGADRQDLSGRCRRVLEILKQVNRTSLRKYNAILDRCDPDDARARDLLMYHGAGTGRWSGKGVQVQNFPRGKNINAWGKKGPYFDMDRACEDILSGDVEWMAAMSGDVMELLSGALRGTVIASPGKDLVVADYAAIEARCVLWEANATEALKIFLRTDTDIYCDMATGIYGFEVRKKDHPNERQFGKQAVLGLGYGMGFLTFLFTCRKYLIYFTVEQVKGILKDKYEKYYEWCHNYLYPPAPKADSKGRVSEKDMKKYKNACKEAAKVRYRIVESREDPKLIIHELALMKYTVDVYRNRYPEVKQLWTDQEEAAMAVLRDWEQMVAEGLRDMFESAEWLKTPPGVAWRDKFVTEWKSAGRIDWAVRHGFLCCRLPSGRILRYRDPELKSMLTSWGEKKTGIRYMTVVTGGKWARTHTYGGKIVENITQAVARDIMADAILRSRGTIYSVLMSVHDELVAEVDEDKGSVKDFEGLMSTTEAWAEGCPIVAEGNRFKRYRK